jgi:hypothetical protein
MATKLTTKEIAKLTKAVSVRNWLTKRTGISVSVHTDQRVTQRLSDKENPFFSITIPEGYAFTDAVWEQIIHHEPELKDKQSRSKVFVSADFIIQLATYLNDHPDIAITEPSASSPRAAKPSPDSGKELTAAGYELTRQIISLVKEKGSNREAYTQGELGLLQSYAGRGGYAKVFDKGDYQDSNIKGFLSEFYTPDPIVQAMWGLAYKHGFTKEGLVLEPACGTGRFFTYHNPALIEAYEIDYTAYCIAKIFYPQVRLHHASFETQFFKGNFHKPKSYQSKYDLVIGNPPYEEYQGYYAGMGEKDYTKAQRFDHYFITRGLDLLKSGGLMVFIIPSNFLRADKGYNDMKKRIHTQAQLIDGYRMPNNSFEDTYVGTDILVFKKR